MRNLNQGHGFCSVELSRVVKVSAEIHYMTVSWILFSKTEQIIVRRQAFARFLSWLLLV